MSKNLRGFPILIVLCGFYGNTGHKPCESNKTDRYHVMAAPPLVHRKGHACSRDQQRHQDDHGCRFICARSASRGHVGERACHFLLNALHGGGADANLAGDLEDAFTGMQ